MLTNLTVRNFAIIEQSSIDFHRGFTTITGETGAGKSILVGALQLILGQRANLNAVLDDTKKSIVEATFRISDDFKDFFDQNELDFDVLTIVRREILPGSKSRAFINDTPVNLDVLRQFSAQLVDLHQQHESLSLTSPSFQRKIFDIFSNVDQEVAQFSSEYEQLQKMKTELQKKIEHNNSIKEQEDFIQFQFNELRDANIKNNELKEIEESLKRAENTEEIRKTIIQLKDILQEGDISIIDQLKAAVKLANELSVFVSEQQELASRLTSVLIELEDIESEVQPSDFEEIPEDDIDSLTERSDLLNRLLKKHNLSESNQLLEKQNEFFQNLEAFENSQVEVQNLQKSVKELEEQLHQKADSISQKRKAKQADFEHYVKQLLHEVGLDKAQIELNIESAPQLNPYGKDNVEILFSANEGIAPQPLKEIASGGELSRLMLSLKSIIADKTTLPTMIFDEIDTGISGEVAKKVGRQLKKLAQNHQIISITHLPQIAAKADNHLKVKKDFGNGKTRSSVARLDEQEKITEVAELLSGQNPSESSLQAARELMND